VNERTEPIRSGGTCRPLPDVARDGTLRNAIDTTHAGDEIRLLDAFTYQLTNACGPLVVDELLTIRGCASETDCDATDPAQVVIEGAERRLVYVSGAVATTDILTLSHLTLTGGEARGSKNEQHCEDGGMAPRSSRARCARTSRTTKVAPSSSRPARSRSAIRH